MKQLKELKIGDSFKLTEDSALTYCLEGLSLNKGFYRCRCLEDSAFRLFDGDSYVFSSKKREQKCYRYFVVKEGRRYVNHSVTADFCPYATYYKYKVFTSLSNALSWAISTYNSFGVYERENLFEFKVQMVKSSLPVEYDFDLPFEDDPKFSEDAYYESILDFKYFSELDIFF